jgi:hypothetical protein
MNRKNKLVAFTVAIISSISLGNPALAGWGAIADDVLRVLGQASRSYGDDVLRGSAQVSGPFAGNLASGAVRLVRQPRFDRQTGNIIATFAVGGAAGYAGSRQQNSYSLIVNCRTKAAFLVDSQQRYQRANFNSVKGYFCR